MLLYYYGRRYPMDEDLWTLELWENSNGNCPSSKSLDKIARKDPNLFTIIVDRIERFKKKSLEELFQGHKMEDLKNGLVEFKVSADTNEFRMLGVLEKGRKIYYALHAYIKKDQKIMDKERDTALDRLKEYKIKKQHEV